jgi:CheY-like chemotaxis protein
MELNRVLIVDDDPAIRRVVSALLDLDEYGLLEAADGQAALEVVRVEWPDLVKPFSSLALLEAVKRLTDG